MKTVVISIVNYNGNANTIALLRSLKDLQLSGLKLRIVVVDNASKEPFVFAEKSQAFQVSVIRNPVNAGFSGGHNKGIQFGLKTGADYVMLLNNDTVVDKHLLYELVTVAESEESIGLVGPKIYFFKGFEFHKERYAKDDLGKVIWYAGGVMDWKNVIGLHRGVDEVEKGQYDYAEETEFVSGCCMLIKREVLMSVGMLDSRYFLYYEDIDYNQRVKQHSYKIMYVPKGIVWHKNAASAGGSGSTLQDYYITRNRLLLGFSYSSFPTKLALIRESLGTLINGRSWQRRGVLDFYRGELGMGSYYE